jgi:hypothetical protein
MIRNILRWRFAPLLIPFAAVVSLSPEGQDDILIKKVPNGALIGPIPALLVQPQAETALPSEPRDIFVKLLQAHTQEARRPLGATAIQHSQRPLESGKPKVMTMLSISCYEQGETQTAALLIRCRTDGYISNSDWVGRIVMKGVVTEDVVSAGKILIAAGSKVAGVAHVDPDSGRVESKGDWSIIADNHQVRVHGEVQDADTGFHGIQGKETSFESEPSQRQAVVRDGRYCFVADKTPFVLSIKGEVSITLLQPLESEK